MAGAFAAVRRLGMIDFEQELAKFQLSLEVDQAEDAIHHNDLSDVTDIIKELMDEMKKR